jgi:lipopolysaccharide biosynthesis glycosyltransferase
MLHSVLQHRGRHDVRVHYLHGGDLPAESERALAEMVERDGGTISFVEVPDEVCAGLPVAGFTGKATWYRAFVPELLPDLERILFLDADLIATASLEPLWDTDLGDHYLAAVTNVFQDDHIQRAAELGLAMPQDYFNAGVMLLNLELMRSAGCCEEIRAYGKAHAEHLTFRDQDALNVVLGPRRRPLHPRWNCMNALLLFPWSAYVFGPKVVEEARRDVAIRHFEGPGANKPWHFLCTAEMRELYFEHRRQTPWPRVRTEGVTPRNVVKRAARALRFRLRS